VFLRLAALYAAITILLAWPLSIHPASQVMSIAPDTDLFLWTLAWDAHAFVSQPLRIFDANIYAPQRLTLAYSENLIGSALLAAPVLWATGNPVLAMNAAALASCVLCGLGTYWLARAVGISRAGATLAGIVFAFAPARFLRLDQMHLAAMQWIPFAVASAHRYFDRGRRRELWLTLAFFTLQVLSSGHGAIFLLLALLLLAVWRLACGHDRLAWRRRVRDFGWPGVAILVPVVGSLLPYVVVQREMGLRRTLEDWAVPATSFLASPAHFWAALLGRFPGARVNETAGAYLFPGIVAIGLGLAAFWPAPPSPDGSSDSTTRCWWQHPRTFYAALTLLALWLAAGPPIGLWPVVYWWPGFNFVRAPSRFVLLAIVGLAVLAGFGFDRLTRRLAHRAAMAGVVGLLLVLDSAAMPLASQPYTVEIPAIDRWLTRVPGPVILAEVPLADSRDLNRRERRQTLFMLHSTAHWHQTVHGYSGIRPPQHDALYRALLRFPDHDSLTQLDRLGVTHIVVHTDLYAADEWPRVNARLAEFGDRLQFLHQEADGRVYALVPARQ
jgi:hypothetical protein